MPKKETKIDVRTVNLMTGKGGEAAVMSELLFRHFNACILNVDSGVDIAAIKNGKTYLIQVKTKHWNKKNQFVVILELDALNRFVQSNTFLVLVGRDRKSELNDYVILPIKLINDVSKGLKVRANQRGRDSFKFLFRKRKDGEITLNKYGKITQYVNAWNLIK